LELAKKLGADFVVDYGKSDPVEQILAITGGAGADEVVETSGADIAPSQCVRAVRKGGRIAIIPFNYTASLPFPDMGQVVLKEVMISGSRENPNVSAQVITMLDNKMIDGEALITHVFPLEEYEEGLRIFAGREDNCIKVVIEP
jgi:threonine dehydrogenase-like Zn-dependent dehydrogenase